MRGKQAAQRPITVTRRSAVAIVMLHVTEGKARRFADVACRLPLNGMRLQAPETTNSDVGDHYTGAGSSSAPLDLPQCRAPLLGRS
jgi:hypothetical protein